MLVSRPLGFLMHLAAAGVLFWALIAFVAGHDIAGGVIKLVLGGVLLYVGGRTKAQA